jgi:hypothetical protein
MIPRADMNVSSCSHMDGRYMSRCQGRRSYVLPRSRARLGEVTRSFLGQLSSSLGAKNSLNRPVQAGSRRWE